MPAIRKITNIPTREEADLIAQVMKIQFDTYDVKVVEQPGGLFTVIGTPPAAGAPAAMTIERVDASSITHPDATLDRVAPMLELIGEAESTGNYNAIFGDAGNTETNFTAMPIDDVIAFQKIFVRSGSPSSAVGKYQIIRKTLKGLKRSLDLNGGEVFEPGLQDQMALQLLKGRGLEAFLVDRISENRFINNIAMEWAGLPNMTGNSHYAGDGLNQATVTLAQVQAAVRAIKA